MKIKSLRIKNFRGYCDETTINFEDLTAFVGQNDMGKSSILEALDIFFNDSKGVVKLDKDDVNVGARANQDNEISKTDVLYGVIIQLMRFNLAS